MTSGASVGTRNRVAVVAAVVALLIGLASSPNFHWEDGPKANVYAGDFIHEYAGGWIARHADRARFYDQDEFRALQHDRTRMGFEWDAEQWLPIVYPPFYYLAVSPLSALPFRTAALVFVALMALCFAATLAVLLRAHPARRALLPWLLLASGIFAPLWESLVSAQKGTLLLLLLTLTWTLWSRGRGFAAGLAFGGLAFKPQLLPVIGLVMLLRGEWAFVAGSVTAGVVLGGVSLGMGLDVCRQYALVAAGAGRYVTTPGFPLEQMHCWYGFFRLLWRDAPLGVTQTATGVAALGTIAVLMLLLRRRATDEVGRAVEFSGCVLATILLSFHLLEYDLTILLLPIYLLGMLLVEAHPAVASSRTALLALLAACVVVPGVSSRLVDVTHVQLSVPVMAGLLVLLVRLRRPAA